MMWLIASLIGGFILKAKAVVLLPLAYLASKKSKELALAVYFFYGVILVNEVFIRDVLSYEGVRTFILIVLPSLMVLKEVLEGFEVPKNIDAILLFPIIFLFLGILHEVLFFAGIIFMVFPKLNIKHFVTAKNLLISIGLLFLGLITIRLAYEPLYTPETQVAIVTAFTILATLKELTEIRRVEFRWE
ncbi:hypothetical protein PAP_09815 [Palaeococcus pacificus DY20341]|uniref:Uncharacterized protein n=1 Tax=Palaeococcus pacificus DY20341 TaxID=1343739 RepID=A0A075M0N8_9EURY|nr:hypothetical protein [Palaeococcus pacificus]AIF70338.1 hypothetical protein PAP_09815 [Palaeococcus pacificus DY20341]